MDIIGNVIQYLNKHQVFKIQSCSKSIRNMTCFNKYWFSLYSKITTSGKKIEHKNIDKCITFERFIKSNPELSKVIDSFDFYYLINHHGNPKQAIILDGIKKIKCSNPYHYVYKVEYDSNKKYLELYLEEASQLYNYNVTENKIKESVDELHNRYRALITQLDDVQRKLLVKSRTLDNHKIIMDYYFEKLQKDNKCSEITKSGSNKGRICCKKIKNDELTCLIHKKK